MVNKEAKESGGESRRGNRPQSGEAAATDEDRKGFFCVCEKGEERGWERGEIEGG